MKFLVLALALVASASAGLTTLEHAKPYAQIVKSVQDVGVDGTYNYAYETDSGIAANEEGHGGVHATGKAAWTSPEGVPVEFSYTADEFGYKPVGSHIPEMPAYIARALEYIRSHPAYEEPAQFKSKTVVHVPKVHV